MEGRGRSPPRESPSGLQRDSQGAVLGQKRNSRLTPDGVIVLSQ